MDMLAQPHKGGRPLAQQSADEVALGVALPIGVESDLLLAQLEEAALGVGGFEDLDAEELVAMAVGLAFFGGFGEGLLGLLDPNVQVGLLTDHCGLVGTLD